MQIQGTYTENTVLFTRTQSAEDWPSSTWEPVPTEDKRECSAERRRRESSRETGSVHCSDTQEEKRKLCVFPQPWTPELKWRCLTRSWPSRSERVFQTAGMRILCQPAWLVMPGFSLPAPHPTSRLTEGLLLCPIQSAKWRKFFLQQVKTIAAGKDQWKYRE